MKIMIHAATWVAAVAAAASASAQSVLFDFNTAPVHTSLPIDLTEGGISAHFSATGQGFSIQDTTSPVVPAGFTGRFIYPNSVFSADLLISFDRTLTAFSILYSPQELGCDDSATMRVTASLNGTFVGTATKTASHPGTWPVDTLSCAFPQGFDSVIVHYDSPPPTCQDIGSIFLADDMRVTPAVSAGTPFCFGDGSGSACPCGNFGAAGHGCANAIVALGGLLTTTGVASVSADTLVLVGSGMPNSAVIYFQGTTQANGGLGIAFGDGLRCAGGTAMRLAAPITNTGNGSSYPTLNDARISIKGSIPAGGAVRTYQAWYRNPTGSCGSGFNLTNGVRVNWMP
jgi:hypothetical protein